MASNADLGGVFPVLAAAAVAGYLLGSLPFGYWVARSRGVNIFEVGSKSAGATNVRRVLGKGPGSAVLALDLLKGAVAAGWPSLFALLCASRNPAGPANPAFTGLSPVTGYLGLAFALVGHSFSCFTWFRGGKGVATAAGGLSVLMPSVAAISAAIWVVVFFATRYVSLASILAALALPVLAVIFGRGSLAEWVATAIAVFVLVRHRANIGRLLAGTEKRFERRRAGEEPPP